MSKLLLGILVLFTLVVGLMLAGCGKGAPGDADLLAFAKAEAEKGSSQKATLGDTEAALSDVDPASLTMTDSKNVEMEEGTYRWTEVKGKTKDGREVMLNVEYQPKEKKVGVTNFRVKKKPDK